MSMIKVIGGTLYQWDIGRKVKVTPHNDQSVCEVHFAHQSDKNALVVIPKIENGEIFAEIPNILLQSSEPICAHAVQKDDAAERSFCNCTLFVRAKPKPEDYVYTETERLNFDFLAAKVDNFEKIIENLKGLFSPIANVTPTDGGAVIYIQDQKGITEAIILHGKKGENGNPGADGKSAYQYAKEAGYAGSETDFCADLIKKSPTIEQFEQLSKEIADLKYIPIDITKITNSVGTAELGSIVNDVTINWTINKTPTAQSLDGDAVDPSARSKKLTNLALNTNKTFTLAVADERDATDSASTSINFLNGVYYGVCRADDECTSEAIRSLTRKLQSSKGITFTVNAGAGQHIVFALPTRYGTPNFNVGGFDGGFSKVTTFSFTNASGYSESYDVWLTDNSGLGDTTVKVS